MDHTSLRKLLSGEGFEEVSRKNGISVAVIHEGIGEVEFDEDRPFVSRMIGELSAMTAASFGMPLDETSNDGTRAHIQGVTGLAVLHDSARLLGFASGKFPKEGMFYLHGVAISPLVKRRGGARALTEALWKRSGLDEVSFTTQNPVMFCLLRSMCKEVYPNPNERLPFVLEERAKALVQGRAERFDAEYGVLENLYGRCLYERLPESNDASVNQWFAKSLQVKGQQTRHGFLFIGRGVK